MKPGRKLFYILLGALTVLLIVCGLFETQLEPIFGKSVMKSIPDAIMFAAVGVMLWNRKIVNDEKKVEAERKQQEAEAAARDAEAASGSDVESGTDASD